MNTLSCEQLMQIIVELDTSYKKEMRNKEVENRCLKRILYENVLEQRIEIISYDNCYLCEEGICNYKHWEEDDDDDREYEMTIENIFVCKVCNKRTCSDCNWAECCRTCFGVRKKVIECREIVDKIKSHSDSS